MNFDPRDCDSRDDHRRSTGRDRDEHDARTVGRGPGDERHASENRDRGRQPDSRWDGRDRDGRERDRDPRDAFSRHVHLPRGLERELVRDRDREYTLRGSESRTLATVGAFRVVSSRDLRDHDDRAADPRSGDLRHLRESGLVATVRMPGYRDQAVVLTKEGDGSWTILDGRCPITIVRIALATAFTWVLVISSFACSPDAKLPDVPPPGQRLPEIARAPSGVPQGFSFLYDLGTRMQPTSAARAALPFESIILSRSACMGTCPVYRVALNVDGTAAYEGLAHVERIGKFAGSVQFYDFAQLVLLAERAGFMTLQERYAGTWIDDATTSLTIRTRKGQEKRVDDYGAFGPPELWALQRAIDGVVESIKWR